MTIVSDSWFRGDITLLREQLSTQVHTQATSTLDLDNLVKVLCTVHNKVPKYP